MALEPVGNTDCPLRSPADEWDAPEVSRRHHVSVLHAGRAVSFLAWQKGRLAACKQRQVMRVAAQAVNGALQQLMAAAFDAAALR